MRRFLPLLVVCLAWGPLGCGSGAPGLTSQSPPPPPARTPITPDPVTFTVGPVSDTPDPVFGTAPFTLEDAEVVDIDDDGDVDLGWVIRTVSATATFEAGSRPGTRDGGFTSDFGGSSFPAVVTPLLTTGNVLGVGEEGLVYGVQSSATSIQIFTFGFRVVGNSRSDVGGFGSASGTLAGLVAGDVDGDAIDDVVLLDAAGRRVVAYLSEGETGLEVGVPTALPAGSVAPQALAAGSLGPAPSAPGAREDLVIGLGTDGYVVLVSTGTGGFLADEIVPLGSGRAFADLVTGDFDDDGLTDVAGVVTQAGEPIRIGVLFGRGNGTFEDLVTTDLEAALGATTLAQLHARDVNGDAYTDLVCVAPSLHRGVVLLSDAAGRFVMAGDPDLGVVGATVGLHDLDEDGDLDLLLGNAATLEVTALLNDLN